MVIAVEQMIRNIRVYADFWVGKQFCPKLDRNMCNRLVSPSAKKMHLALNGDWCMVYVSDVLGRLIDRYVANVVASGEI